MNWQKGIGNTFLGNASGEHIQGTTDSSDHNTFLGAGAGDLIHQGSGNICLGAHSGPDTASTLHDSRLYINMIGANANGVNSYIYGDQSGVPSLLINADVTIKNGNSALSASNNPSGNLTVYGDITGSSELKIDTISEKTSEVGVTIDGVLLKDNNVTCSTISSGTNADILIDPNGTGILIIKGATDKPGQIQFNCKNNTHGVIIKGPLYSELATTYTLSLPNTTGGEKSSF